MIETDERYAVEPPEWPRIANDQNHPFGDVSFGAILCAYCAAENMNSACLVRVKSYDGPMIRMTEIYPTSHLALLAAGSHPDRFEITGAAGYRIGAMAITQIRGTAVCRFHIHEQMKNLR